MSNFDKANLFQALLLKEFPVYQNISSTPSLLRVRLHAGALNYMYDRDGETAFIARLKEVMPADLSLYEPSEKPMKMDPGENGFGSGRYDIIFATNQVPPQKTGEDIPIFDANSLVE